MCNGHSTHFRLVLERHSQRSQSWCIIVLLSHHCSRSFLMTLLTDYTTLITTPLHQKVSGPLDSVNIVCCHSNLNSSHRTNKWHCSQVKADFRSQPKKVESQPSDDAQDSRFHALLLGAFSPANRLSFFLALPVALSLLLWCRSTATRCLSLFPTPAAAVFSSSSEVSRQKSLVRGHVHMMSGLRKGGSER